jgi:ATP-dependent RNA helicase DeaD
VWVSLSIGRNQQAEPRWLIPMICRNGGLAKRDIGQIKLLPDRSLVQLEAQAGERFLQALGKRTLERGITVTRLEGTPDLSRAGQRDMQGDDRKPAKKPHRGRDKPDAGPWKGKPKRQFGAHTPGEPDTRPAKPWAKKKTTEGGKPAGKPEGFRKSKRKPGKA